MHQARLTNIERLLMTGISWIEFRESAGRNSLEHLLREDSQKLPADIQRLEYRAILVATLRDEVLLEFR